MDIGEHCWVMSMAGSCIKKGLTDFITYLASKPGYKDAYAWIVSSEEERDVLLGLGLILGTELNIFVVPLWRHAEVQLGELLPTSGFSKIYLYDFADVMHNLI